MNIKLNVPNKLSEIALSDYVKYLKILEINEEDENSDVFVQQKVLEIFCGVPYNESLEFKMSDVSKIVNVINNTLSEQPSLVKSFKLGDTEFGFIPKLDDMSFGEYIDIDTNIGDWDNMYRVMSVLYRPIKQKSGEKYLIDEYKGDLYHDAMRHTPMDAVISSLVFFLQFRQGIINGYDRLFGDGDGGGLDATSNFNERYGWYNSIQALAEFDVLKIDEVTRLNVHTCLHALSYKKEKNELESSRIKNKFNK